MVLTANSHQTRLYLDIISLILAPDSNFYPLNREGFGVSVNTTSAPSATCLCRRPQLGIDRQCTHSLHRNDMAYCHFELCGDCGLGCFSESFLDDIQRLSVVAVVFL